MGFANVRAGTWYCVFFEEARPRLLHLAEIGFLSLELFFSVGTHRALGVGLLARAGLQPTSLATTHPVSPVVRSRVVFYQWSRALSNSAVDRRVLWNQLPELVKDEWGPPRIEFPSI